MEVIPIDSPIKINVKCPVESGKKCININFNIRGR